MVPPLLDDRVLNRLYGRGIRFHHQVVTGDPAVLIAGNADGFGHFLEPAINQSCRRPRFVSVRNLPNRRTILKAKRLDYVMLCRGREKRFSYDRILDQVEQVRRIPPQIMNPTPLSFSTELSPRRSPVFLIPV